MNKFEDARMNKFEDARMNKFEDARSTGQKEENIMGKYEQDARLLLEYVGGKENIAAVSHCVSRMRFVLNDPAKADVAKIEALKSAKGTFTQAGQFQVIIGNTVSDFYNDFIAVSGIDGVSKEAVKSAAKQNQNALQKVMSVLAEIFAPLIPAIITGGLILGFRNCIDSIYFFNNGTQTLCNISQFWSGVDSFLWLIGEAIFHMLPVCICWSVTKKMGTTQSLGIVLGLTLVSGQLLNAYAVASTAAVDIPKWDFGFFTINMIGYQAQVIPAMLAAFTLVYLEKFFRKICPAVISMIVVPFCSLVLSVIIAGYSVTRPGALEGVKYFLVPNLSNFSWMTVVTAMGQMFYSLSIAMGILVTFGSYMKKNVSIEQSTENVEIFDTAIAIMAGLMIIPAVFAFSGGDPDTLQAGPALMFITIPKVFASMGMGTAVGVLFFVLVLFAALTSSIALTESAVSTFEDELGWDRTRSTVLIGAIMVALGSLSALGYGPLAGVTVFGMQFLDFFDFLTNSVMMPIAAIATCLLVSRIVGVEKIEEEVTQEGQPFRRKPVFNFMLRYLCPIFAAIILASSVANALGWIAM